MNFPFGSAEHGVRAAAVHYAMRENRRQTVTAESDNGEDQAKQRLTENSLRKSIANQPMCM
jgi:hypothetical protein